MNFDAVAVYFSNAKFYEAWSTIFIYDRVVVVVLYPFVGISKMFAFLVKSIHYASPCLLMTCNFKNNIHLMNVAGLGDTAKGKEWQKIKAHIST